MAKDTISNCLVELVNNKPKQHCTFRGKDGYQAICMFLGGNTCTPRKARRHAFNEFSHKTLCLIGETSRKLIEGEDT